MIRNKSLYTQRDKDYIQTFEEFSKHVKFIEDPHSYLVDGKKIYTSVTSVIELMGFPAFDEMKVSNRMYRWCKHGTTRKKKAAMKREEWHHSRDLGTEFHLYCENYFKGYNDVPVKMMKKVSFICVF